MLTKRKITYGSTEIILAFKMDFIYKHEKCILSNKKKHERCVQIFLYITKTRGRQMFFINHTQTPSTNSPDYIYISLY